MSVLAVNAGSSSLKFALYEGAGLRALAGGLVDWLGSDKRARFTFALGAAKPVKSVCQVRGHGHAMQIILSALAKAGLNADGITAVGHRVVHGGTAFTQSVRIDAKVRRDIKKLSELAPLHNPQALAIIKEAQAALPKAEHVAVFDTTFYVHLPEMRYVYPLPWEWYADWGVRRFGFHGISHAYVAGRAAQMLGTDIRRLRLVSCHLGNGASATATRAGRAIATTMGYTPMEGLAMGSRSGSVDPGILLHVQRRRGVTATELDRILNHGSGLLGVSGVSSDFRKVEIAAAGGHARARLACEIFADRVRSAIGALTAALGGVDVLVFTAGIGENSAALRRSVCRGLECLGLKIDGRKNSAARADTDVAAGDSTGRILVIATQEELKIAREAMRVAKE